MTSLKKSENPVNSGMYLNQRWFKLRRAKERFQAQESPAQGRAFGFLVAGARILKSWIYTQNLSLLLPNALLYSSH
jgi:hypothetical protein